MRGRKQTAGSIGPPVFSGSEQVERASEPTILGQTPSEFELILPDDPATGETEAVCGYVERGSAAALRAGRICDRAMIIAVAVRAPCD